jgi:acetoin:2,6-dichlorophenolindophenol oxidoreductase subunit alpha
MSAEPAATRRAPAREEVDLYTGLYRRMLTIRQFEETVQSLFLAGDVHGTTHLYSGQEAVAVGIASVLSDGDQVAATYRGHGCALALGLSPQALMDELLGRATGICAGRAGSMNVVDREHGLIGCFSIVGGSIAAATGAGLALRGSGKVAVAFFGDGAVNQAYLPECLNFAKVMSLPMVYVCENNRYGEFTPFEHVTAGDICARPAAMGIPSDSIDGNDVWVVRRAAREAVERARSGEGPSFIEALTYRFVGHSRSDPGKYRPPGELENWRERDPLSVTRNRLVDEYGADAGAIDSLADEAEEEVQQVRERALAAPFPDTSTQASEFKES